MEPRSRLRALSVLTDGGHYVFCFRRMSRDTVASAIIEPLELLLILVRRHQLTALLQLVHVDLERGALLQQ